MQGDVWDLLVAGVAEVQQAQVGTQVAGVAGDGDVPERVRGVLGALDYVDLRVGADLVQVAAPDEESVLRGVVVRVLGDEVWRW